MDAQRTSVDRSRGAGWGVTEWFLGIVGGIALFLGFFVMFAGEGQSIGLGGDLSWEVGEISDVWMYGFIVGGAVLLVAAISMAIVGRRMTAVQSSLVDLVVHTGVFLVVNGFIWAQDIALGEGVDYAWWVTVPWGIGLLTHAGVYLANRSRTPTESVRETVEPRELQRH